MRIFEEYSVPDAPARWFDDWDGIARYLADGGQSIAAWPESVGSKPRAEQVVFTPDTQRKFGAMGRMVLHSPAMIKVIPGHDPKTCLATSSISYWSEKGARARSFVEPAIIDEVDWKQLQSIVGPIERRVRREAPGKLKAYPIMPDAFAGLKAGSVKLWWGEPCGYGSPLIVER